jgi:uncharacterized protein YbjT (DUF2867 family)
MIFVTGASGNVGKAIVQLLLARQVPFRVGARLNKVQALVNRNQSVQFDFCEPATFEAAVSGCDAVFLMRPPAIANTRQTLNVFIDAARRGGVKQIVFLSVAGAGRNAVVPHHAVEVKLKSGPAGWTILRPGFFAQNLGDAYRADIQRDSRIYVPAGRARVAFVDARDIAEVAVNALVDPASHQQSIYTLTGPAAISFDDVAQILSRWLSRSIRYSPATVLGYMAHLQRRGLPATQIAVQTILHVGLRFGQAEKVDHTLAHLLAKAPRTVDDYVRDHRQLWLQGAQTS